MFELLNDDQQPFVNEERVQLLPPQCDGCYVAMCGCCGECIATTQQAGAAQQQA